MPSCAEGTFKNKNRHLFLNSHSSKWHVHVFPRSVLKLKKLFMLYFKQKSNLKIKKSIWHSEIVTLSVGPHGVLSNNLIPVGLRRQRKSTAHVKRPTLQMC
jgi:hypothetical protein